LALVGLCGSEKLTTDHYYTKGHKQTKTKRRRIRRWLQLLCPRSCFFVFLFCHEKEATCYVRSNSIWQMMLIIHALVKYLFTSAASPAAVHFLNPGLSDRATPLLPVYRQSFAYQFHCSSNRIHPRGQFLTADGMTTNTRTAELHSNGVIWMSTYSGGPSYEESVENVFCGDLITWHSPGTNHSWLQQALAGPERMLRKPEALENGSIL